MTLNVKNHLDFRPVYLLTYVALRSCATMAPASGNFCRCFPGIERIAGLFGLHRSTVFRSLDWLEEHGYIYRKRRGGQSSLYTIVVQREIFVTTMRLSSVAAAQEEFERWLQRAQQDARHGFASGERVTPPSSPWSNPEVNPPKSPGSDFTGSAPTNPQNDVAPQRLEEVARERRRSGATQIKIQQLGGSISKGHLSSGSKPPEGALPHKEGELLLPRPICALLKKAAKQVPQGMTAAQRQARWEVLQRQRELLLAEAAEEERSKPSLSKRTPSTVGPSS